MMGTLQPAASRRFLISGTAAAASGTFTVTRTISEPASASSRHCCAVPAASAVSVLVMDCTTMGAPPPTRTWPTFTPYVLRRGWRVAAASEPAIWVSIPFYFSVSWRESRRACWDFSGLAGNVGGKSREFTRQEVAPSPPGFPDLFILKDL